MLYYKYKRTKGENKMVAIVLITCGIMAYNIVRYAIKKTITTKDLIHLVLNGMVMFGTIFMIRGDI